MVLCMENEFCLLLNIHLFSDSAPPPVTLGLPWRGLCVYKSALYNYTKGVVTTYKYFTIVTRAHT